MARHRALRIVLPSLDRPRAPLRYLLVLEIIAGTLVAGMIVAAVVVAGQRWPAAGGGQPDVLVIDSPTALPTSLYVPVASPSPGPETSSPGDPSATPSPSPTRSSPPATPTATAGPVRTCLRASYRLTTRWPGGLQAQFTITNCGTATASGWQVGVGFSGSVTIQVWDADASAQRLTAIFTAKDYNRSIAPGASVTFGFNATWSWSGSPRKITGCTLAQGTCSG